MLCRLGRRSQLLSSWSDFLMQASLEKSKLVGACYVPIAAGSVHFVSRLGISGEPCNLGAVWSDPKLRDSGREYPQWLPYQAARMLITKRERKMEPQDKPARREGRRTLSETPASSGGRAKLMIKPRACISLPWARKLFHVPLQALCACS